MNIPVFAQIAIGALVIIGSLIALIGSMGLVRLKSYFERVHAPSIIATMGTWLVMWSYFFFFFFSEGKLPINVLLISFFLAITIPITSIFLMRASLFRARTKNIPGIPIRLSAIVENTPVEVNENSNKSDNSN